MELQRIVTVLLRRWWLVIGIPLVVLGVSLLLERQSPWVASIRVSVVFPDDPSLPSTSERPGLEVLDDVTQLVGSAVFADAVIAQLQQTAPGYVLPRDQIATSISVDYYGRILTVRVTRPSEQEALAIVEAARASLESQVNFFLVAPGAQPATVRLIEPASTYRDSPATTGVALIVQTLVALAIGCGLAALAAAFDQRIHGRSDVVAVYDGEILGDLRRETGQRRPWRWTRGDRSSGDTNPATRDEPARALLAVLDARAHGAAGPMAEGLPGAPAGPAPSYLLVGLDRPTADAASRLARALVAARQPAVVLATDSSPDGDGDRAVASWLDGSDGESPALAGPASGGETVRVGTSDGPDPVRGRRWAGLLAAARDEGIVTLCTVPPFDRSADGMALAPAVSACLLVVTVGRSDVSGLLQARAALEAAGGTVAGVVLDR